MRSGEGLQQRGQLVPWGLQVASHVPASLHKNPCAVSPLGIHTGAYRFGHLGFSEMSHGHTGLIF